MFNFQGASSLLSRLSRAVSQVSFAIIPNPPPFVNTFFHSFLFFSSFLFPFLQPPRVLLHCSFFLYSSFVLPCGRFPYFTYYMLFSLHLFLLCGYILILFSLLLFLFSLLVFLLIICIFIFSLVLILFFNLPLLYPALLREARRSRDGGSFSLMRLYSLSQLR